MNLLTPLVVASLLPVLAQAQRPELNEREAAFVKLMSGCKMVGSFTMRGSKRAPQQESYTIAKIEKVRADRWRFFAKIEYGKTSVTVPLVVQVEWAGDTPMIQVTGMKIPMLGTYTARVLIYRNHYAGMWAGKDYGGHMFGMIVRDKADAAVPKDAGQKGNQERGDKKAPGQGSGQGKSGQGKSGQGKSDQGKSAGNGGKVVIRG